MQCADHRRSIEQPIYEGKTIHICGNIYIFLGLSQSFLRLFELSARIIKQNNALKARIARRVSSGTSSEFQKHTAALRQETLDGDGFRPIFVLAPTFIPKGCLVIRAFIVTYRRSVSHGVL